MTRSSYSILGLAAGIGLGIACGFLLFDRQMYVRLAKKLRKTTKAVKRQQAEWRDMACDLLKRGEERVDQVKQKSKRVYQELAS
jgi:uncharacterized membrane protein YciS (DUF1049 family)